jgi:hypothetical protein
MSKRVVRITGTLVRDGKRIRVPLNVTVAELPADEGVKVAAISRVELASADIPDGDYTLEYFCFDRHNEPVQVKHGVFVARQTKGK